MMFFSFGSPIQDLLPWIFAVSTVMIIGMILKKKIK